MNANQILSADVLDLIFNDRNKAYGAYELRKSYDSRIKKALGITSLVLLLGIGGHLMAGSTKTKVKPDRISKEIILSEAPVDEPPPPPPPPPPVEPIHERTEQLSTIVLADVVPDPPPTQTELENARIDVVTTEGVDATDIVQPSTIDGKKDVIEQQVIKEPEIWTGPVEIETSFNGNWTKFLERNLNGNVPVDNGAPAGKYTVLIQFVIDQEGKVSEIKALTNMGYGMEQEAIRVLKKADKWSPAIQNGRQVKTYRRQPITFKIDE